MKYINSPKPSLPKSKFRYNWKTNKWDELFWINTDAVVIHPGGRTTTCRYDSPMLDIWEKVYSR